MWIYLLLLSTLTGTVLDEKNRPIEGAVVVLFASSFGEEPRTAAADAEGRYQIAVGGRGPFRVEAYAPGFTTFRARDVDLEKPLSIVLRKGGEAISGVVRDGTTLEPLEGAIVETRGGESSAWVHDEPRLGVVDTLTDARGEFRLEGLSKASHSLRASAPGYGRTVKENVAPGEPVELFLFPGSGIYGRLLDEKGVAVEGALVAAESADRMAQPSTPQRSDAEGRFAFLGLEPGTYHLFTRHDELGPAVHEVELAGDEDAEVELVLSRGVSLSGRLVNENDEPVSGKVSVRGLDGKMVSLMLRSRYRVESDSDGWFSIGPLPAGAHTLLVESRGYASQNIDATVTGRAAVEDLGDITLETGLSISGKVVGEGGEPIVAAAVNAVQPGRGTLSSAGDLFVTAETDEEGRFDLAGLSPGSQQVHATAPGYGMSERVQTEPGASGLTLTLKLAGSIRGTVVDTEGHPVTSFRAMARSSDHRGTPNVTVQDVEGIFVLDTVAEGEYAVEVLSPGYIPEAVSSVRVSSGNVTEIGTIRLRRGGSLRGTVVDGSAEPVPGATVGTIVPGPRIYQSLSSSVTTDRLGRFQILGLNDGKVTVVASHPSYAETRLEGIEIDSSSAPSEVEVVIRGGGTIEGVVRTRDGTDVAARVIEVGPREAPWNGKTARTSEDGSFRIDHLPAGRLIAGLKHTEANATLTVQSREVEISEGETTFVEFDSRRVVIHGQVKRDGSPLSGVEIELTPKGPGFSGSYSGLSGGPPLAGPRYLMGVSGEDGYYELLVGEPGEYSVSASAFGVGLPWREVTIPDVEAFILDLDFGGASVSGRVIDKKTESPVPGAFVMARSATPSGTSSSLQVGSDGLFELELEPGEFTLVVRADGYGTLEEKITLGEGGRSDLVVSLSAGLDIRGRILDRNGQGVPNVRVMAVEDSPDISAPPTSSVLATTISDGSFRLEDLAPGRYNILAASVDAAEFAFLPSIASGSEELDLVLRPGGKVEGLVVDGEGVPVANAIVALAAIEGKKVRGVQSMTDGGGRLELKAPRGNLTIKAVLMNGPEGLGAVSVSENATARVQIVLVQTASNRSRR